MTQPSSRDTLLKAASLLFRQKGYAGVGLAEILAATDLPKGSLYYHFPGGKRELAEAATRWAAGRVVDAAERAFADADAFNEGAARLAEMLGQAIAREDYLAACPVLSILQSSRVEPALRAVALEIYQGWTDRIADHAARLGVQDPQQVARALLMQVQGAWVLAFAECSSAAFAELAGRLRTRAM